MVEPRYLANDVENLADRFIQPIKLSRRAFTFKSWVWLRRERGRLPAPTRQQGAQTEFKKFEKRLLFGFRRCAARLSVFGMTVDRNTPLSTFIAEVKNHTSFIPFSATSMSNSVHQNGNSSLSNLITSPLTLPADSVAPPWPFVERASQYQALLPSRVWGSHVRVHDQLPMQREAYQRYYRTENDEVYTWCANFPLFYSSASCR